MSISTGGLRSRHSGVAVVGDYLDVQEAKHSSSNRREDMDISPDKDVTDTLRRTRVTVEVVEEEESQKENTKL